MVVAVPDIWLDVETMADLDDVAADFRQRQSAATGSPPKYWRLTQQFFTAKHGIQVYRIVESLGATEGAPAAGSADIIVDITSSGSTLRANRSRCWPTGWCCASQACLVASRKERLEADAACLRDIAARVTAAVGLTAGISYHRGIASGRRCYAGGGGGSRPDTAGRHARPQRRRPRWLPNQRLLKTLHAHSSAPGAASTFIAPRDGLSHVSGDRSAPLLERTIPQMLAEAVHRQGPRDAAVFLAQDKRFSWDEFGEAVDAFAAGLVALGLEKGDRIGIWSPNRWEWLVTQFATARAGLILVNINPAYRLAELEYALNKVGCRALVTAAQFKTPTIWPCCASWRRNWTGPSPAGFRRRGCPRWRSSSAWARRARPAC